VSCGPPPIELELVLEIGLLSLRAKAFDVHECWLKCHEWKFQTEFEFEDEFDYDFGLREA
jgi:hypothetical protein